VRWTLDEDELVALFVTDVVLLGNLQQLLAQQENVAVEHRIALGTAVATLGARAGRPQWGHFTSFPANSSFRSYDEPHSHVMRTAIGGSGEEGPHNIRRFPAPGGAD
jgi:hypothetical protein